MLNEQKRICSGIFRASSGGRTGSGSKTHLADYRLHGADETSRPVEPREGNRIRVSVFVRIKLLVVFPMIFAVIQSLKPDEIK